ncbi:HIT domain-containing protein [Patescibacteria group bacterium]|nr:HIT domain-containing protein [Patescibacteria group bacterium]MCL5733061.1 HIT domain-containing protein [Patescibacteria group bacterium]
MSEDFSKRLIKDYKYWAVYIHENQGYLGRCIIWCKRENAADLTDATPEEQNELFLILRRLKKAEEAIFRPDWFNYAFLGNETRHLHAHFIPRYAEQKEFSGVLFEDKLYGHNYKTDKSFITPEGILNSVKDRLAKELE